MQINEFETQMSRLLDVWHSFYNDTRKQIIWNFAKRKQAKVFENIVTHFVSEYKQAPSPNEIIERLARSPDDGAADLSECSLCGSAGWLFSDCESFVVRCECAGGQESLVRYFENIVRQTQDTIAKRQLDSIKKIYDTGVYANILLKHKVRQQIVNKN